MQTRKAVDEIPELPPPPAPTARDANPWSVETEPVRGRRRRGRHARVAGRDPVKRSSAPPRIAVVLAVAFLMLGLAVMRIRESGEFEDIAGIVFAFVVLLLFAVTRGKSRRRSKSGGAGHDQASS